MDLGHEHFLSFTSFFEQKRNYKLFFFFAFYSTIDEPLNIDKDIFDNLSSDLGFGSKIFLFFFCRYFHPWMPKCCGSIRYRSTWFRIIFIVIV